MGDSSSWITSRLEGVEMEGGGFPLAPAAKEGHGAGVTSLALEFTKTEGGGDVYSPATTRVGDGMMKGMMERDGMVMGGIGGSQSRSMLNLLLGFGTEWTGLGWADCVSAAIPLVRHLAFSDVYQLPPRMHETDILYIIHEGGNVGWNRVEMSANYRGLVGWTKNDGILRCGRLFAPDECGGEASTRARLPFPRHFPSFFEVVTLGGAAGPRQLPAHARPHRGSLHRST